jgi:hypothetical protein
MKEKNKMQENQGYHQNILRHMADHKAVDFICDAADALLEDKSIGEAVTKAAHKMNVYLRSAECVSEFARFAEEKHMGKVLIQESYDTILSDPLASERKLRQSQQVFALQTIGQLVTLVTNAVSDSIDYVADTLLPTSQKNGTAHKFLTLKIRYKPSTRFQSNISSNKANSSTKSNQTSTSKRVDKKTTRKPSTRFQKETSSNKANSSTKCNQTSTPERVDTLYEDKKTTYKDRKPTCKPSSSNKTDVFKDLDMNVVSTISNIKRSAVHLSAATNQDLRLGLQVHPRKIKETSFSLTKQGVGLSVPLNDLKKTQAIFSLPLSTSSTLCGSFNPKNPLKSTVNISMAVPIYGVPVPFSFGCALHRPQDAKISIAIPTGISGCKSIPIVVCDVGKIRCKLGLGKSKKKKKKHLLQKRLLQHHSRSIQSHYDALDVLQSASMPSCFEDTDVRKASQGLRKALSQMDFKMTVIHKNTPCEKIVSIQEDIDRFVNSSTSLTEALKHIRESTEQLFAFQK